jgi:hypothetical protein
MASLSPESEILLYRSTIPVIIIIEDERAIAEQIAEAKIVEESMRKVVQGEVSLWEAFEACENLAFNMDEWLDEVEEHLSLEFEQRNGNILDL